MNPLDAKARPDLSYSYGSLGGCLGASGDLAGALETYARALTIRRDLAARDPKNQRFQHAVVSALSRIGYLKTKAGDASGARESYGEAVAIQEALCRADPSNVRIRQDLAGALGGEAEAEQALAAHPRDGRGRPAGPLAIGTPALWQEPRDLARSPKTGRAARRRRPRA